MKLHVPSWASIAASLVMAALAAVTQAVHLDPAWSAYLTGALVFLAGLGVSPLVAPKLIAALHLSHTVALIIASGLSTVSVAFAQLPASHLVHAVGVAVFAFLAGIGFAPVKTATKRAAGHRSPTAPAR